jgi:hypothetical protein
MLHLTHRIPRLCLLPLFGSFTRIEVSASSANQELDKGSNEKITS